MVLQDHEKIDGKDIAFSIGLSFPYIQVLAGYRLIELRGEFELEMKILASLCGLRPRL